MDNYKIFIILSDGSRIEVGSGFITHDNLRIPYPCDGFSNYEIRLYSSECYHNEHHYLYTRYSWYQCISPGTLSLEEMLHPQ